MAECHRARYVTLAIACGLRCSDTSFLSLSLPPPPPPTSSPPPPHNRSPKLGGAPCGEEAEPMSVASVDTTDTMSEGDAPPAFTRGSRVRASLPVVRSTNQTKDRSLGKATPTQHSTQPGSSHRAPPTRLQTGSRSPRCR